MPVGQRRRFSKPDPTDLNALFIAEYKVNRGILEVIKPALPSTPIPYSSHGGGDSAIPLEDNIGLCDKGSVLDNSQVDVVGRKSKTTEVVKQTILSGSRDTP